MTGDEVVEEWVARLEIRRCAEQYARAADTGDADLFIAQFATPGVIEAPDATYTGPEELRGVVVGLCSRFDATFHGVLNQTAEIAGETADAQTYCLARHFFRDRKGAASCFEMTIRYHDELVRNDGAWRFSRRRLEVIATQRFPVHAGPTVKFG
ncbi:nuclear transport factor 2 family protein [Agromyces sp. NPDC058484]|uniref:nuclear transport factor 2 family protein n=1 Tax=Agromyces sp. NPDC058484 TaxID=3346524 RepID=UPI0036538683